MIKIVGNDILREGGKIGWISGNDIFNSSGQKAGYFSSNDIYDRNGHKIGYVEGSNVKKAGNSALISVERVRSRVVGGIHSDVCRAAIFLLFGI